MPVLFNKNLWAPVVSFLHTLNIPFMFIYKVNTVLETMEMLTFNSNLILSENNNWSLRENNNLALAENNNLTRSKQ